MFVYPFRSGCPSAIPQRSRIRFSSGCPSTPHEHLATLPAFQFAVAHTPCSWARARPLWHRPSARRRSSFERVDTLSYDHRNAARVGQVHRREVAQPVELFPHRGCKWRFPRRLRARSPDACLAIDPRLANGVASPCIASQIVIQSDGPSSVEQSLGAGGTRRWGLQQEPLASRAAWTAGSLAAADGFTADGSSFFWTRRGLLFSGSLAMN